MTKYKSDSVAAKEFINLKMKDGRDVQVRKSSIDAISKDSIDAKEGCYVQLSSGGIIGVNDKDSLDLINTYLNSKSKE